MPNARCTLRALAARLADTLDRLDERFGSSGRRNDQSEPLLVTLDVAAERLSISKQGVERLIANGEMASTKLQGRRLVPVSELRRLAEAGAE